VLPFALASALASASPAGAASPAHGLAYYNSYGEPQVSTQIVDTRVDGPLVMGGTTYVVDFMLPTFYDGFCAEAPNCDPTQNQASLPVTGTAVGGRATDRLLRSRDVREWRGSLLSLGVTRIIKRAG